MSIENAKNETNTIIISLSHIFLIHTNVCVFIQFSPPLVFQ